METEGGILLEDCNALIKKKDIVQKTATIT